MSDEKYADLLKFRESAKYDEREKTALAYTEAIIWDAKLADDALWEKLHRHFTEPELVELGFFVALTFGQQRWIGTLDIHHHEVMPGTSAGLDPTQQRLTPGGVAARGQPKGRG